MRSISPALGLLLIGNAIPLVAYSEVYLTEEQAVKSIFPDLTFSKRSLELTAEEQKKIEDLSGQRVRAATLTAWTNAKKQIVFIDQVIGKHEFITYAVGISPDGKVQGIEILEYRESYGQQVKEEPWRKQFVGKTKDATLKVGSDISNISGATLSSTHVTAGVKRILQTYECVKGRI
jgi:Na+-translocating ferredoxin:NAD+ oxidoreductase RnfG subunit